MPSIGGARRGNSAPLNRTTAAGATTTASVTVTARLRPASTSCVRATPTGLSVDGAGKSFDNFLSRVVQGTDQATAHAALGGEVLQRLRAGYNATLVAYGQTGSGKTVG